MIGVKHMRMLYIYQRMELSLFDLINALNIFHSQPRLLQFSRNIANDITRVFA